MRLNLKEYYLRPLVSKEVTDFLKGRWAAIHLERKLRDGRNILLRYLRGKPLTISSEDEFRRVLIKIIRQKPRTFYGSASIYRKLETREDALNYEYNVVARTPTWDIDSKPEWWKTTIIVAQTIVDELEKEGVYESVWVKWSGRGIHVHIHENAISQEIYVRYHPVNISYSIVGYIISKIRRKIHDINIRYGTEIKVENLMDPQRVFTAPMSLHRTLLATCIAMKPQDLENFDPSWTDLDNPIHNVDWRKHIVGEADQLAKKALTTTGGYPQHFLGGRRKKTWRVERLPLVYQPPVVEEGLPLLKRLRLVKHPGLRVKLSKGPEAAWLYLENLLSLYALGLISREKAILHLRALEESIRLQNYSRERKEALFKACEEAIRAVKKHNSTSLERILLSNGPPKEETKITDYIDFP